MMTTLSEAWASTERPWRGLPSTSGKGPVAPSAVERAGAAQTSAWEPGVEERQTGGQTHCLAGAAGGGVVGGGVLGGPADMAAVGGGGGGTVEPCGGVGVGGPVGGEARAEGGAVPIRPADGGGRDLAGERNRAVLRRMRREADAVGPGRDGRIVNGGLDLQRHLVPAEPRAKGVALLADPKGAGDRIEHRIVLGLERHALGGDIRILDRGPNRRGIVAAEDRLRGRDDVDGDGDRGGGAVRPASGSNADRHGERPDGLAVERGGRDGTSRVEQRAAIGADDHGLGGRAELVEAE